MIKIELYLGLFLGYVIQVLSPYNLKQLIYTIPKKKSKKALLIISIGVLLWIYFS